MMLYASLYHPPDGLDAHEAFGANCGPCALAAVLRRPVMAVQRLFPSFAERRYVNPSQMRVALQSAGQLSGVQHRVCSTDERERGLLDYGVACIFFTGPWSKPGVPIGAAYQRSHWIGVAMTRDEHRCYYDVNAWIDQERRGAWVSWAHWDKEILPQLVASYSQADGGYSIRWAAEVMLPHESGTPS